MEQVGVQFIAAGGDVYISTMEQATKVTDGFADATEKGGGKVSGAGEIMIGALRHVGAIAVDALMKAGQAVGSFLQDSVDLAGDFQAGMLEFQSVAGQDVDTAGLEKFHDLFLDLGKKLPVSTSEVQQAAIEMVKGGIDPAIVAAGGLEQNIQFAAAAMKGDLAGAAEISAKILGGWSNANATAAEQAEFLTHSTDLLTKAANASSVDVKELSLGIFNAQGIAKTAGVSFDDLTTTLAELAPRFASSSEAGTSLKNMIARLQPTTKAATAAFEGLGLITEDGSNKFYDAQGNFVGFSKASQLLQDSLKGLTKQQQASILQTMFGNDAMGSAAGLAELGAEGYDAMAAKMEKANGVAAAAALIQGSFNTKLDNAKGSLETLKIVIGEQLLPVIGSLLDNYITPAINAVTGFAESVFKASDPVLFLASKLHEISPELGNIAFYLIDAVRTGDLFTDWLTETPQYFQILVHGIQGALNEFSRLSDAYTAGGLQGLIDTLIADITAALPGIQAALLAWGQALIDWIAPFIPPLLDKIGELASAAWGWIKEQAPGWRDQLVAWGAELVAWVAPMIPPLLADLGKLAADTWQWVTDQAAPLLDKFSAWADSLVKWIPGAAKDFLEKWPGILDNFLTWIGVAAGPILLKLGEWGLAFVEWLIPTIPKLMLALAGLALGIGVFILETVAVLIKKLIDWGPPFYEWIQKTAVPGIQREMANMGKGIVDWIVGAVVWLERESREMGVSLTQGIQKGIMDTAQNIAHAAAKAVSDAIAAAKEAIGMGSPAKMMIPVGYSMPEGAALGIKRGAPLVMDAVTQAMASPVASAAQMVGAGNSTTTYNQQRSYSMPIYTNQGPAVLQQSLAIAQATMA